MGKKKLVKYISEETWIQFDNESALSYTRQGEYVNLYNLNKYLGYLDIWFDAEMDKRQYICVNYTIIYLDTLHERLDF